MSSLEAFSRRAFAETCDPAAYVPRAATEAALLAIRHWGESDDFGSSMAALIGTPGLGKTQLLRVTELRVNEGVALFLAEGGSLAGAVRNKRALYLPYAGLALPDLAVWIHGLLGISPPAMSDLGSPTTALESLLQLGGGPFDPFFLMIDDADAMPPQTVDALVKGLPRKDSPLRILLTLNPDSKAARLLAALHPLRPTEISFTTRMSVEETARYVRARMQRAGFSDDEVAQIGDNEAARLHSLSLGVPRRLHELAAARYEARGEGRPRFLDDRRPAESWTERSFEDDLEI